MTSAIDRPLLLPRGVTLSNRIAKAAMSEQLATRDHQPSTALLRLYETWAGSGCGLLITGNIMVDRRAVSERGQVVADKATSPARMREWARAAHGSDNPAVVLAQLNHAGRQIPRFLNSSPIAPSAVRDPKYGPLFAKPRPMGLVDIRRVADQFEYAAQACMEAGFDGVQVHAAHGYLLSQFLSPDTNQRADHHGGSVVNRARLLVEVVERVRAVIGDRAVLAVKLNSDDFRRGGLSECDAVEVVELVAGIGVDLVEVSGGGLSSPAMVGLTGAPGHDGPEGYFTAFARRVRTQAAVPLMLTGGFRTLAGVEHALMTDTCDVIGLARPLTLAADAGKRLLLGHDVRSPDRTSTPRLVPARLRGLEEILWHTNQMWRLAAGEPPDAALSAARSAAVYSKKEWRRAAR